MQQRQRAFRTRKSVESKSIIMKTKEPRDLPAIAILSCLIVAVIIGFTLITYIWAVYFIFNEPISFDSESSNLKFVAVVYRHGDRNPARSYMNDPYKNGNEYKEGWSNLTERGHQRMKSLGKYLRNRYETFLSSSQSGGIYIQSSAAERCILSAKNVISEFLPLISNNGSIINDIPIHVISRNVDNMIAAKLECKLYDEELQNVYKSSEVNKILKSNEEFLNYISSPSCAGEDVKTIQKAEGLYNILDLQRSLNLTIPSCFTKTVMEKLKEIATVSLNIFTKTTYMRRVRGGPLLNDIIQRMENNKEGKNNFVMYSGHDLTLINLLRAMGLIHEKWKPNFAGTIIYELYNYRSRYFVKMYFSNGFGFEEFKPLLLSNCEECVNACGEKCTLENFKVVTRHVRPFNWYLECEDKP